MRLGDGACNLFFANLRPLRLTTAWMYLFGGLWFAFPPMSEDIGLEFLLRIFEQRTWVVLFFLMAVVRVIGLVIDGTLATRLGTASLGVWLWSILLVSEVLMSPSFLSFMLIVSISIEFWIIAQYLTERLDELRRASEPPHVI